MKTKLLFNLVLIFGLQMYGQVGIGTTDPHESSIVEIKSNNKGFLIPRLNTTDRNSINGGVFAEGLCIFNTDLNCLEFYNGSEWQNFCSSGTVPPPALPANIVLTAGQTKYIASIYDDDYTPYVAAAAVATTGSLAPTVNNGTETLVNIQGVLDITNGVTVQIPYTVSTGTVDLPLFEQTKTVISAHVQGANINSTDGGGAPVDVIFSYGPLTGLTGTGTIPATIKAVGNDLNAVKLDINLGIGTDYGILLAEFTIALDDAGNTGSVKLKDMPGIPDRMIGIADNTGNTTSHDFLYLPVVSATGRTWLNNNLGANYSNLNHPEFNLSKQATSSTDWNAYGSLFQWGRKADGHELMNWSDGSTGMIVNGTSSTKLDTPSHADFIKVPTGSWRENGDVTLWENESSTNNVCPDGFRLPLNPNIAFDASNEFFVESGSWTNPTIAGALGSSLVIPMAGYRSHVDGLEVSAGSNGYYWSGTASLTQAANMQFHPGNNVFTITENMIGFGFSVRCIQD